MSPRRVVRQPLTNQKAILNTTLISSVSVSIYKRRQRCVIFEKRSGACVYRLGHAKIVQLTCVISKLDIKSTASQNLHLNVTQHSLAKIRDQSTGFSSAQRWCRPVTL